jgi:transcription initiation factor TFIIE subunit alpha
MVYYTCPLTTFSSANGAQKPFSEVTEEDQELMTPDEYTAYFEVFQARS